MPTQLLSIGPATTITQNVVYALPVKACVVNTTVACQTSIDGSAWNSFTSGGINSGAGYIRCTTADAIVTCLQSSGSGGGVSLPTAPLGQVLISQGAGVAPIFSATLSVSSVNGEFASTTNQGSFRGNRLQLSSVTLSVAGAGTVIGEMLNISDSTVTANGATVVGSGSNNVLARWNGSVWKVIGA